MGAPLVIADGLNGKDYVAVPGNPTSIRRKSELRIKEIQVD